MKNSCIAVVKLKKGDIFQFEPVGGKVAYGQIAVAGEAIYVIVYKNLHPRERPGFDPANAEIALCGWTLDGRIYHEMWKIVGNSPVPENVPRPCYRVANDGIPWVESFEGKLIRLASEKDSRSLDYRTTVAPIRFEKALAAIHGLQEWDESFEKIRVEYARERERAC